MRAEKAIEALEGLKNEATTPAVMSGSEHLEAWKGKVRAVTSILMISVDC
jgi:hypothetical protein